MDYYSNLLVCANRYSGLLAEWRNANDYWGWSGYNPTEAHNTQLFIEEFRQGCLNKLPLNKLNRWLGYIQGCLICWRVTTVETERDFTRPLFRPLDFKEV
jgi:hypothetical protein